MPITMVLDNNKTNTGWQGYNLALLRPPAPYTFGKAFPMAMQLCVHSLGCVFCPSLSIPWTYSCLFFFMHVDLMAHHLYVLLSAVDSFFFFLFFFSQILGNNFNQDFETDENKATCYPDDNIQERKESWDSVRIFRPFLHDTESSTLHWFRTGDLSQDGI